MDKFDLIVVGSGAAGLSAAIYAGRYKMSTLVLGKEFGGETATAGTIENWPGTLEIDGYELMANMKKHAESLGAKVDDAEVEKVEKDGNCFNVFTKKGEEHHADTVIFALGSERRRLGLPNERELTGKGVHYCMTCDGPLYSGKTIAIVGGGDASVKGVNLAAEYVEKIYLIVRGNKLKAEPINREQMEKLGDKVEILFETEVKEIIGDKMFEKVILTKEYNGSNELDVDGLFIEIGAVPNVTPAEPLNLEIDERGYIKTDNMMKTNVEGVYAAGDIVNHFGAFKQDITASAMGSVAATSAYEHFKKFGDLCEIHQRPEKAS